MGSGLAATAKLITEFLAILTVYRWKYTTKVIMKPAGFGKPGF